MDCSRLRPAQIFSVCKKIKPRTLEELSAVIAIARPGALDFVDDYSTYVRTGEFQSVHEVFDEELSYTGGNPIVPRAVNEDGRKAWLHTR